MADLEARELRYFVAVAEELNFSRAAQRLGIAQPPLSRAIRQLETRLGVTLFERSPREVRLTAAGRTLLEEADHALAALSAAARRTRRAAPAAPTLVATAKPGLASGLLQRIVTRYATTANAVPVTIAVSGYREQADMVRDGRADCALLSSPIDARGLDLEPLVSGPRVAALPATDELAGHDSLRCRDLRDRRFAQWPGATRAELRYWSGRDADDPSPAELPPPGPAVRDILQQLEVVALGQAVALIPALLAEHHPRPDVAYRPVVDATPYAISIAWADHARGRPLAAFVRAAIELAAADGGTLTSADLEPAKR
jgi:DNA-binding transcriptional LysR family regulator